MSRSEEILLSSLKIKKRPEIIGYYLYDKATGKGLFPSKGQLLEHTEKPIMFPIVLLRELPTHPTKKSLQTRKRERAYRKACKVIDRHHAYLLKKNLTSNIIPAVKSCKRAM